MDIFFRSVRSLERMTKLNAFSFSVNSETKERKGVGTRSPHSLQLAARSLGRHATNSQTGLEKRRHPPPPTHKSPW